MSERDEFGDWRLTESSTRLGWMSRAQMPKHVRVFAMWFIFRMIGAVIRSFFSKPPAPVEKKMVVECETAEAFAEALAEAKAAKRRLLEAQKAQAERDLETMTMADLNKARAALRPE